MLRVGILLLGILVISSCAPRIATPAKTQLQIREFQTRSYPEKDSIAVMKAVINALQDEGYIIKNADKDLGFITATKEVDIEDGAEAFWMRFFQGMNARYKKNSVIEASANITQFGSETRVRLVFQARVIDNFGSPLAANQIEDGVFYQNFFSKVDKSLFIEKNAI